MSNPLSKQKVYCPRCSSGNIAEYKGGFIEVGEWEGQSKGHYEEEYEAQGYECKSCITLFYIVGG